MSSLTGTLTLNVAAICHATRALGPGLRAVVWVQGCPLRCPGCIAPSWQPFIPARTVNPAALLEELLVTPGLTGLTFSGGEPMHQAAALAQLARLARHRANLDIVCYTGYTLAELRQRPPSPGVAELLAEVDVLIDGPYRKELNDQRGLRGSTNQQIHHLTSCLTDFDWQTGPRRVEIRVGEGSLLLVGIPSPEIETVFQTLQTPRIARGEP